MLKVRPIHFRGVSSCFGYDGTYAVPNAVTVITMPQMKMTIRGVEAIKLPQSGQTDYWDSRLPGFGIRVNAGGRKTWTLMYRHGNRKRRLTIGTYPAMTLARARDKASAALTPSAAARSPACGGRT